MLIAVVMVLASFVAAPHAAAAVVGASPAALAVHGPIDIEGNGQFNATNGVVSGSGTAADPYVLAGWSISAVGPIGLQVRNTDVHAVVRDVAVTAASVAAFYFYNVANVTLSNITATVNTGDGVRFESSRAFVVEASNVTGNAAGLVVLGSSDAVIRGTNFTTNSGDGAVVSGSTNITLVGNGFAYNGFGSGSHGIDLAYTTGDVVHANRFTANGIFLDGDALGYFNSHTITADNLIGGLPVLYEKDCAGLGLTGMDLGELILAGCRSARVTNLTAAGGDTGILMAFVNASTVGPGVSVSDAAVGIQVTESTGIGIAGVSLLDTATGIQVDGSRDVTVSGSKVSAPFAATGPYDGIAIQGSDRVNVSGTVIRHHRNAIAVTGSGNVSLVNNVLGLSVLALNVTGSRELLVVGNRVAQDTDGFHLQNVTASVFSRNAMQSVLTEDANVSASHGLEFAGNLFGSAQVLAFDASGVNDTWDGGYPAGGNYWATYHGVDLFHGPGQNLSGPDGFGDTPYAFNVSATDRYPRMVAPATADLPPDALFLVAPVSGNVLTPFRVSANLSSDFEDPLALLTVRWSWDTGATWTPWTVDKFASHLFAAAGLRTISLQVRDTAGLTDTWSESVAVGPKADLLPPAIRFTPPPSAEVETPIAIVVNVTDDSVVANVTLLYQGVDGGAFHALAMQVENNGTNFTVLIPAQPRTGTILVVVFANDTWANEARAPLSGAATIAIVDTHTPLFLGLTLAAGLVTVAGLVFLVWRRRRARKTAEAASPPAPERPPGKS